MARRIIIPARLASTRLPNKPLLDICGKPMIQRVYEQAIQCAFDSVVIATDSQEIADVAQSFGASVCMTLASHISGTDRIAEAVHKLGYASDDIIVNIQGDEPLIPLENVKQVANLLESNIQAVMSTLCEKITDEGQIFDSNCVKVVMDKNHHALYFSRASIPWERGQFEQQQVSMVESYRHIGLYAYRASFLSIYEKLAVSPIELWESLEQLRVLWHGHKIAVAEASHSTPPGVDTAKDLEVVRRVFACHGK